MIELPNAQRTEPHVFADWAEACALFAEAGTFSVTEISSALSGRGIEGAAKEELFDQDSEEWGPHAPPDDAADRYAAEVMANLRDRRAVLGEKYPFEVEGDVVERRAGSALDTPCYTLLLLMSLLPAYDSKYSVTRAANGAKSFQHLFEKVVQFAQSELLGRGQTSRFGWPREAHFPTPFERRLESFAAEMGVEIQRPDTWDGVEGGKDAGLDLATRLSLGDELPGTMLMLTQCATGAHWRGKNGEPPQALWNRLITWNAVVIRAIAVPFWLGKASSLDNVHLHFSALVLDRRRLMHAQPDSLIDSATRVEISEWITRQGEALPSISQTWTPVGPGRPARVKGAKHKRKARASRSMKSSTYKRRGTAPRLSARKPHRKAGPSRTTRAGSRRAKSKKK